MTHAHSPFRVDVLDASGDVLGDGSLTTVVRLDTTARLDAIGEAAFTLPAADPRTALIQAGGQFDIYDEVDGYLGRYRYKSKRLSESGGRAMLTVRCWDQLRELALQSVYFRRVYVNEPVEDVVDDLIALVAGWSADVDTGIGSTTVSYEGESVLAAINELRERWGMHLRLASASTLAFGAFGADADVRLTNLPGQVQFGLTTRTEVAIVNQITLVEESDEIVNRVIPLGAGQGVAQLTIEPATVAGDYTKQEGVNDDGSSFWYIEDTASQTAYGLREKVLAFPNIRPITNSDANVENAANALKLATEVFLANHTAPSVTYDVTVKGLRKAVKPGDKVRLAYRGVVEGYTFIDVDQDFYVLDVATQRDANGDRSTKITICTIAERRTTDTEVVLGVIHDLRALKVHVPITLAYAPVGPYVRRVGASNPAAFTCRIGTEVLALNYAILRFKTGPLLSSVTAAASGGGSTPTSNTQGDHQHKMFQTLGTGVSGWGDNKYGCKDSGGGGETVNFKGPNEDLYTFSVDGSHNHTVTISPHTHTMTYGLYADTVKPATIRVAIDGVDRTSELGGPWDTGGAGTEVEVDITTYLVNASGGLRQNHTIAITCDSGRGEVEVEVDMLVTIQPIAVS